MPPLSNAPTPPDDWLDLVLQRAFAADPGAEAPAAVASVGLEDALAVTSLGTSTETTSSDEPWPALTPGSRYVVLGEAGRGGLGVVYRGHDRDLGREVALKALDHRLTADPGFVRRFVAEAQVCGRLQHPGVVPVHELGLDQTKRPYFVMKLITGQTFAEVLAARHSVTDDRRRCLDAFEKVCHTIAYAHDQGVVHRDLKPANVMIGAFGEVQVVDWGLAIVLAQPPDGPADAGTTPIAGSTGRAPTVGGTVSGTPAYMPPEQARGESLRIDARSDVFALGALLAEILTGEPVHTPELDKRTQIDRTARGDLSSVQRRLEECGAEPDLVALALHCLAPEMADRPASAAVVAKAVGDHLAAVEERSRQAQLRAVAARARARATLVIASLVVVMLSAGSGAFLWWLEDDHRRESMAVAQVDAASAEVVRLTERARAGEGLELAPWEQARLAAQQTVQLAEALPVPTEMRDRIRQMESELTHDQEAARLQVNRRQRDREMVQALLAVRIPEVVLMQSGRRRALDARYADLFSSYIDGRELSALSIDDASEALRSDIQAALATGLDLWSLALVQSIAPGAPPPPSIAHLQAIARQLDGGDSRRNKLRDLLGKHDPEELARMASEVDLTTLSASSIVLLAELSARSGALEQGLVLYERACDLYPRDTGAAIGTALLMMEAGSFESAVGYWRIARTLAPDHSGVHLQLGACLERARRWDDAAVCYREALALTPTLDVAARNLHDVLRQLGRHREATEALESCASSLMSAVTRDPSNVTHRVALANLRHQQGRTLGHGVGAVVSYLGAIALAPHVSSYYLDLVAALLLR
jgi:Flp pilus assembly protein TadD